MHGWLMDGKLFTIYTTPDAFPLSSTFTTNYNETWWPAHASICRQTSNKGPDDWLIPATQSSDYTTIIHKRASPSSYKKWGFISFKCNISLGKLFSFPYIHFFYTSRSAVLQYIWVRLDSSSYALCSDWGEDMRVQLLSLLWGILAFLSWFENVTANKYLSHPLLSSIFLTWVWVF